MEKQPSTLWYIVGSAVAVTVGFVIANTIWGAVAAARAANTSTPSQ